MLMTAWEWEVPVRMGEQHDKGGRDAEPLRQSENARPDSGVGNEAAELERVRALQNFARRMDKVLLGWMAKHRPAGGESND